MLRPVALGLLVLLVPLSARAVETMRISMGDAAREVRVAGEVLSWGEDVDEPVLQPLARGEATVRLRDGRLELDGAPVSGDAVRFRGVSPESPTRPPAALRAAGHAVRGDVVVRPQRGRLQLINVLPLEDYLAAVLGSEMPVSFPLEALKAQAVAARTYALQKKLEAYDSPFHLGSSVLHQVYGGLAREDAKTRAAVEATRGEVLTWEFAPIEAYFHASCGGRTESGAAALGRDLPYLQSVPCPCGELSASRWSATFTAAEVRSALREAPREVQVAARTATGRVARVRLGGEASLDGATLRQRLGYTRLKSLWFELSPAPDGGWRVSGRGYGHGAGLCQWGAKALADRGTGYRDILAHYYPGVELQRLY